MKDYSTYVHLVITLATARLNDKHSLRKLRAAINAHEDYLTSQKQDHDTIRGTPDAGESATDGRRVSHQA